jgi:hypothetical protein
MNRTVLQAMAFFVVFSAHSALAQCTAVVNGNWNNAATWSCGVVPTCGQSIIIPAGITVTVNTNVNLEESSSPSCNTPTFVEVFGTLNFGSGRKMYLACNSNVVIHVGGTVNPHVSGAGESNLIEICNTVVWAASNGSATGPLLFGPPLGLASRVEDFRAAWEDNSLVVEWVAISEKDNSYFTVSVSNGNADWKVLQHISGIGDHELSVPYMTTINETNLTSDLFALKLSSTDISGQLFDHGVIYIEKELGGATLYPNPSKDGFVVINTRQPGLELLRLELFSFDGRKLQISGSKKAPGVFLINTEELPSGLYYISVPEDKMLKLQVVN